MEFKENQLSYDDYCKLRESVGWINFAEQQTRLALSSSLYTVTAFEGKKAVGMGRVFGDGIYYTIADVVVHPDYQGQHVGRRIVEKILDYVSIQIPSGNRCTVMLFAASGKEGFYEKLGFNRIPNQDTGAGMKMVIYNKS